jgi:hypothetical protein
MRHRDASLDASQVAPPRDTFASRAPTSSNANANKRNREFALVRARRNTSITFHCA